MNTIAAVQLVGMLVLVVASLTARRLPISFVAKSLLGWAVVAFVVYVGVQNRHILAAGAARVSQMLGIDDQQVDGKTVRLRMGTDGHFWARVTLNGVERNMMIDSGATTTAISEETAEAAGLSTKGYPVEIQTANGVIEARQSRVKRIEIGPLGTDDLGVVIAPSFSGSEVIGMNFLSRLKSWRVEGTTLILEPK